MVWRTSSCTQRLHLLYEERDERTFVLDGSLGHWVEVGLVGRATTLSNHHKLILSTFASFDINLCRQITTGIHLVVHVQRSVLRIAQVVLCKGIEDTQAQRLFILKTCPYLLPLLTVDNSRTRVLAERQDTLASHLGVAQELQGHILIVL